MKNTKIEWATHTFNPWWGCVKVSAACDHCYAESFAKRTGNQVWGKDAPRRFFGEKHWAEPLKWEAEAKKSGERARVFCASMADVMEDREDLKAERGRLFRLIEGTRNLDWLLLTKRPQNFRRFLPSAWILNPEPHVWGMTTVESPDFWWRAEELITTPFAIRGLSMEPLLAHFTDLPLRGVHWVIVGGESGPGARQTSPEWVRFIRNRCVEQGVAFHFKQWGEWAPVSGAAYHRGVPLVRLGKAKAGRMLDARTWDEFPVATTLDHPDVLSGGFK